MSLPAQLLPMLAPSQGAAPAALELEGFWRLFGGGGRCTLRWDETARVWQGVVEDLPGASARHAPTPYRFSPSRLADFVRLADCRQVAALHWVLRYREPR